MRKYLVIPWLLFCVVAANGQNDPGLVKGTVSFLTAQHMYVKFASTADIAIGDTLLRKKGTNVEPTLIVENKSSISCVCRPMTTEKLKVGDLIYSRDRSAE